MSLVKFDIKSASGLYPVHVGLSALHGR